MKKILFYVILSATLFSSMEVALKVAGSDFDAFQLTFLRFAMGGLFLLPFALFKIRSRNAKTPTITKKDYFYLLVLGVICIPIAMVFFQLGIIYSNALTAAVVFSVNPVFTVAFAHFITDEKLTKMKSISLSIGLLGIFFMIAPWNMAPGNSILGSAYSILAAALFGLYSALSRRSIHKIGGLTQTAISFILGSTVMIPLLLILDKPIFARISSDNILLLLYVGIMVTGVGYLVYFLAMEKGDAITASFVFFIKPGLAPIFAIIFLHESLRINDLIGILLVFLASYIILRENKKKASKGIR